MKYTQMSDRDQFAVALLAVITLCVVVFVLAGLFPGKSEVQKRCEIYQGQWIDDQCWTKDGTVRDVPKE